MAALVFSLISSLLARRALATAAIVDLGSIVPPPPVSHVTLDDNFLAKFKEIIVIGDVHGCFDELDQFMKNIHTNTSEQDVLKIFVGDLVNKGPKNREVIQFFLQDKAKQNPTCLAVRGNHDEVVIREYLRWKEDASSLKKKNKWMKDLTEEEVNYLISLPYTLTIPSLNSIIVHAGLVPGIELENQTTDTLVSVRNLIKNEDGSYTGTKNHKPGTAWAEVWSGPSHVYFGHDARRRLQICPHATGLDTGCVYGDRLTGTYLKGPRQGEFVEVKAFACHQPVDE